MSERAVASLEITRYELVRSGYGGNDIVVKQVKALDSDGRYVKFLPLAEAIRLLPVLPVTWKIQ